MNAQAEAAGTGAVDIQAAGANIKMQLMFVFAFMVNTVTVFWIGRRWQANRFGLWAIFLLCWFIDALVPWLYQTVVFGSSFIPTVLVLGFFPAAIIAISIWVNHRKPLDIARRLT